MDTSSGADPGAPGDHPGASTGPTGPAVPAAARDRAAAGAIGAVHEAERCGDRSVGTQHLLLAVLHDPHAEQVMAAAGATPSTVRTQIRVIVGDTRPAPPGDLAAGPRRDEVHLTGQARHMLATARTQAEDRPGLGAADAGRPGHPDPRITPPGTNTPGASYPRTDRDHVDALRRRVLVALLNDRSPCVAGLVFAHLDLDDRRDTLAQALAQPAA